MSPWRLPKTKTTQRLPDTINMIPKRKDPRTGQWQIGTVEWGLHARQGFSLYKVICWQVALLVVCIVFYAVWLALRGKSTEDAQNALEPIAVFIAFLTGAITVLQMVDEG